MLNKSNTDLILNFKKYSHHTNIKNNSELFESFTSGSVFNLIKVFSALDKTT